MKIISDAQYQILKNYEREISHAKEDGERAIKAAVEDAIKDAREQNIQLRIEKDKAESKVEMLEKAFENLGFDIKDMKSILDKLVDGIVSKNSIQLVK